MANPMLWTYRHVVRPVATASLQQILIPLGITYILYSVPGTVFNWPGAIGGGRVHPVDTQYARLLKVTPIPIQSTDNPIPYDTNLVVANVKSDKVVDRANGGNFLRGDIRLTAYKPRQMDVIVGGERVNCGRGPTNYVNERGKEISEEFVEKCAEGWFKIAIPFLPFPRDEDKAEMRMNSLLESLGNPAKGASVIRIKRDYTARDYPHVYRGRATRADPVSVAEDGTTVIAEYDLVEGVIGEDANVLAQPERKGRGIIGPWEEIAPAIDPKISTPTPVPTPDRSKGTNYN